MIGTQHTRATPPLGIRHLMLWVAGCAVTLAVYRVTTNWQEIVPRHHAFVSAWKTVSAMAYGAALAGVGIIGWRRLRGDKRLPCLPGHWLLVLVTAVLDAATTLGFMLLAAARGATFSWYWNEYSMVGHGCGALVVVTALIVIQQPWLWRLPLAALFWLFASQSLWQVVILYGWRFPWLGRVYSTLLGWLGPEVVDRLNDHLMATGAAAGMGTLLVAWLCDRLRRRPGDWIHHAGVAVWIAMGGLQLAGYVYFHWLDAAAEQASSPIH